MSDGTSPNPYAVTTLEIGEPIPDGFATSSKFTRWMIIIAMPLLVIGVVLAFLDIETILGSGPVMLVWGVILLYPTRRDRQFQWFAIACCLFPVVVFLIIFFMSWSPQDAQHPISALCASFVGAMLFGCVKNFTQLRRTTDRPPSEPFAIEAAHGVQAAPPAE